MDGEVARTRLFQICASSQLATLSSLFFLSSLRFIVPVDILNLLPLFLSLVFVKQLSHNIPALSDEWKEKGGGENHSGVENPDSVSNL